MNPFYIEQKRTELLNSSPNLTGRTKLFKIIDFYSDLLSTKNQNLINSYFSEFTPDFIYELKHLHIFGLPINISETTIKQVKEISTLFTNEIESNEIKIQIERLEQELNKLREILYGSKIHSSDYSKISFPVLESNSEQNAKLISGLLESVIIVINKSRNEDNIILVPSEKKINEEFQQQIEASFRFALDYLGNNKKFSRYHEVLIYFQNKEANFEGSSHGIALTIGFIEELCELYNLPYIISIKSHITSSGILNTYGTISPVGKEIIEKKTEAMFFSPIDYFIISKYDEFAAQKKLNELKKIFPQRSLKLIPIENFSDILNQRNIVKIQKQSHVIRTAKYIISNWVSFSLVALLMLIISFFLQKELDNNPYTFERDGSFINIRTNSGKVIRDIFYQFDSLYFRAPAAINTIIKIVDINNDGKNEVITAGILPAIEDEPNRIVCRDKNWHILWEYVFEDTISSKLEVLKPYYGHKLIDTCTINHQKLLVAASNNVDSYSGAIYFLDLKTGMRVGPTFWNSGHIVEGKIKDYDKDANDVLIFTAYNNGFEKVSLGILLLNNIRGQAPSTDKYMFFNRNIADLKYYALFPNTDYNQFKNKRYMCLQPGLLNYSRQQKRISLQLTNLDYLPSGGMGINMNYELPEIDINIGSDFRVLRDTLVVKGKLKPPFTDTPEYKALYRSKIQVWDGAKFILFDEWKKNKILD